jgi:hypothetical protein
MAGYSGSAFRDELGARLITRQLLFPLRPRQRPALRSAYLRRFRDELGACLIDDETAYVANPQTNDVSVVDTKSLKEVEVAVLTENRMARSRNRFGDIAKPGGRFATVCYRRGLSRNSANSFSRWISRFRTWAAISSQRG